MKSLSEVANIVGLERQRIQDYENAGLAVKPSARNKYGYLLYDTAEIDRLWQLKFYKVCGYSIPEIKKLQAEGKLDDKEEAERIVEKLKKKRDDLDNMIVIAEEMAERSISFNELRDSFIIMDSVDPDHSFALMGAIIQSFSFDDWDGVIIEDFVSDEEAEKIAGLVGSILELQDDGKSADDTSVQDEIASVHIDLYGKLSESVFGFMGIMSSFIRDKEIHEMLEEEYGEEGLEFLNKAFTFYCDQHMSNPAYLNLMDSIGNIEKLAKTRHKYTSEEVQAEVGNMYGFICGIKIFTRKGDIAWMNGMRKAAGSQAFRDAFDGGRQRGVAWFISKAIETYLNNLESAGTA